MRPFVEQMITLGKRGDLAAHRQAVSVLRSKPVAHLLFSEVAPRFADRPGGYTRVVKLGPRQGDAAPMAYLELVDYVPAGAAASGRRPGTHRPSCGHYGVTAARRPTSSSGRRPPPGSPRAFGVLFERHGRSIYNYCFRRTADWALAEDLTSVGVPRGLAEA